MNRQIIMFFLIAPLFGFLIFFFYWPVLMIFNTAFTAGTTTWIDVFDNPLFLRFFIFTLIQALLSVVGSLAIGLPTGYLLGRTRLLQRGFIRAAITVPFLFPPLVILVGFVVLFEPAGLIGSNFSNWSFSPFSFSGIVLAHVLYNIALVARITESAFESEPLSYHELADTLGASLFMKFKTITLPHIKPALESALLLVFLYSFNSFAIVLILGEVRLQTIEVMIYNRSRLRFDPEQASILAVFQLLINTIVIFIYTRRRTYSTEATDVEHVPRKDLGILPTILVSTTILITWAPVLTVFRLTATNLHETSYNVLWIIFGSQFDRYLGTSSARVFLNTLFFGIAVSLIITFLGLSIIFASHYSSSSIVEKISIPLTLLPMGTSAITVSFALIQTHGGFSFFSEFVFIYIIAAQIISALPFATRALFSSWQRVPKDLILVARSLGADEFRIFKEVIIPFISSGLFIAFLFSLAISIGEFGATFYLVRDEWTTLSIAIEKLFLSRNTLLPNLYASILVIFALMIFFIIEKIGSVELRL